MCAYVTLMMGNFWDGAHREPFGKLLSDPDFLVGGGIWGGMFGIISFPFVYLATRKRRLSRVAPIILAIVVSEIILVMPFGGTWNTLISAIGTLAISLVLCGTGRLG